jgi:hypothetical protein
MSHEVNNESPEITAGMIPFEYRTAFRQTDEMLRLVDPGLQAVFRFGLIGHVHGPEYSPGVSLRGVREDDPGWAQALDDQEEEIEAINGERLAEVNGHELWAYMNYWVTSAAVIYRHFGGRPDAFAKAEALADEVTDEVHL